METKDTKLKKKLQIGLVIKDMFDKNPSALIVSFPLFIIVLFLAWLVIRWGWEEYTNQYETKELALQSISERMEDDDEEYERKKRISGKKEMRRKAI